MTDEEVGKYMRVLCHLADKGSLCKSQVLRICKTTTIPEAINEKLLTDENGNYYQRRMRIEQEKRAKHIEHQRENANKRWKKDECDGNAMAMPLENENENININKDINKEKKKEKGFGEKQKFIPPTFEEVEIYFGENGYSIESAYKAFNYYAIADWHDSKGTKIRNWKQKMQSVWFKPENLIKPNKHRVDGYYEK
jgi:hypothetical protein